jgi:hypothetical protein
MNCQSCAMPISNGDYCEHCVDSNGNLQELDERIRRMSLFVKSQSPQKTDQEILTDVKSYLRKMPAWHNHPRLNIDE